MINFLAAGAFASILWLWPHFVRSWPECRDDWAEVFKFKCYLLRLNDLGRRATLREKLNIYSEVFDDPA